MCSAPAPTRWQRCSALLDELLELDAPARGARLAALQAEDTALAAELRGLLGELTGIERDGFLVGRALGSDDLAGRSIGAYTLQRQLGAGGMGSVWLGRRSDGRYDGLVAVKLLDLALLGRDGLRERFVREGSALARLAHPHIARLLDAGVAAGGQPYLVLEHVDGEPIDRHCDTHGLGVRARVRLVRDVLGAVAHAHAKLVLHRDLKPANILVTREGEPKLLDFGIAKLLDDGADASLTQQAGRAFTPEYAAPEQVDGGDVSTATDVYAAGVLLFQLLAGRHPTAAATATPLQRLRAVAEADPPRLSEAVGDDARRVRALRGDLDNIVAMALKKDPGERYASAAAFADDLDRYLTHRPVAARADTLRYRVAKFVRRNRLGVGAAAIGACLLVAGVVGTGWQAVEARRERDAARFQAERALAKGNVFNLLLGALGEAGRPLTQRDMLERSVALVERQFGHDPRLAVDLLLPIAGQYFSIGDADGDRAVMQRAATLAAASGDAQLVADVACNTVNTELGRGRADLAQAQLEAGQAALRRVPRPAFGTTIDCLRADAELAHAAGDLERALRVARDAVQLHEAGGHTAGNGYRLALSFVAALHEQRGELAESFAITERLLALHERAGIAGSLDAQVNRRRQAAILMAWGEPREALAVLDTIGARLQGNTPPPWFDSLRGQVLARLGDLPAAEAALRHAAERADAQGSARVALPARFALAQVLLAQRRADEAQVLLDLIEPALPAHAGRMTPATLRALIELQQGHRDRALARLDDELRRLAAPTAARAAALRASARARLAAGDADGALAAARAAVAIAERVARAPSRSADVGEAQLLLARAQQAVGEPALALAAR
jgi:tetratricopeptide (TPR) repeat protein